MKLETISISVVTDFEYKETFTTLLEDAIEKIPACATTESYHPNIVGQYWELDAYEDWGFRYEVRLIPISNGEDVIKEDIAKEWRKILNFIYDYEKNRISFKTIDYFGSQGICFRKTNYNN